MRLRDCVARSPGWFRRSIRPRNLVRLAVFAAVAATAVAAGSIAWIRLQASDFEYSVDAVPAADVALVPGAEVRPSGAPSGYLAARLDIASRLLASGKVKAVLLSGDNSITTYDERVCCTIR